MKVDEMIRQFETKSNVYDSALLSFQGVDGFDVYNTSIPFVWGDRTLIFGRVERRDEWARSCVRLFEKTGTDQWTLLPDSMIYPLEDPTIAFVGNLILLNGTHVQYRRGRLDRIYSYFYRGSDPNDLYYFATGPDNMKDIRLIMLGDGQIGLFSRPRSQEITVKYGSASMIGFTTIRGLDELDDQVIEGAPYISGLFEEQEWGGCNQCYLLDSSLIGVIGHKSFHEIDPDGINQKVYVITAFVFDPIAHSVLSEKVIATRKCFPQTPAKMPDLKDCAFASGIIQRHDGKVDLYSGLGDTREGRVTIDNPFSDYGVIINPNLII